MIQPMVTSLEPSIPDTTLSVEKDSYIMKDSPNMNQGANSNLKVQSIRQMRSVLSFDLSPFETIQVKSATLRVFASLNGLNWGSGQTVEIHKLLTTWTEGNGFNANRGVGRGITWNCATDDNITNAVPNCSLRWNGGSYAVLPSDKRPVTNTTMGIWIEFNVTGDVNSFLDNNPGDNYGWLIKNTNEQNSGSITFVSKESTDVVHRPQLVLTFSQPTEGPAPYDGSIGMITIAFGHAYAGQSSAMNNMTNYHFTGNVSPVVSKIGTRGYLTQSYLLNLKNLGWEILAHSMTHPKIDNITPDSKLQYEIVQSKISLTNMGFCITGYESPYDKITTNSSVYIKNNFKYSVINPNRQNTAYSIIHDGANWHFPLAIHYYGVGIGLGIHDLNTAKSVIDYAIANHTYLILNFHQIDNISETYHTSPQLFFQIIQYVKAKSDAGQIKVENSENALGLKCP